jgi:catechol 2,3-dioxygenase-like lactoylglutathione lyase family enzyme
MSIKGFSHVGLSVADAERSLKFYTDAFGFEVGTRYELGADFAHSPDAPPLPIVCQFVKQGDFQLALLEYEAPQIGDSESLRPMARLGIANFGVYVDALDPVVEKVLANGGKVHRETFLDSPNGQFIHCTDPDGARIELMCLAA